jgi:hypothetical protein
MLFTENPCSTKVFRNSQKIIKALPSWSFEVFLHLLWRQFYLTFPDAEKSYALRSELSWTHWRLVMRIEDAQARDYYIEETARQGWSSRVLSRVIETRSYQRLLQSPEAGMSAHQKPNPLHLLKDPYILEFLDLSESGDFSEHQLEDALVTRLRDFLMELGKVSAEIP